MWAKQSTAATLIVGPILDSAGAEYNTSAVIGDLSISKNGGTLTALASAATLTFIANGFYTLVLRTTDVDTLGRLQISVNKATYQMPPVNLMVVPAMVFDSMILGTDVLTADVTQIGGDTQSATDLKDFADAGYDPATNKLTGAVELDSAVGTQITAIETFATRMTTGLVQDGAVYQFTANMLELGPSGGGGGGGDATLAKQEEILAALQGVEAIQVASPNVQGNLVLTQGDDYDGVANPRAQWTVTTDYTTGWTVRLTIRDADDAVVYTNTGSVVSATVVAVTIAAPTGLTMTGCPGQWQGKFDVELTHSSGKKKTIALGVCYINEDQTR
jgi:hypothetical protein